MNKEFPKSSVMRKKNHWYDVVISFLGHYAFVQEYNVLFTSI